MESPPIKGAERAEAASDAMQAEFRRLCIEHGIRMTHQRREIFQEILTSPDHPTVEQVYGRVRRRIPSISRDTVYRTLWLLRELGMIGTVGFPFRSIHFDGRREEHDHFLCTECGAIIDLEVRPDPVVPRKQPGVVVSTYVELRGICRNCLEAGGRSDSSNGDGRCPRSRTPISGNASG